MTDLPLPWFSPGQDPGPSFSELLWRVSREPAPLARGTGHDQPPVPHATTILAVRCEGGVIVAGDRRATEGHNIAGRRLVKVYPADRWSGVAIAGAAGPALEMVRLLQTELEHYEKVEGEPLSLEGKANKLAQLVRQNLPAAFQGLAVVPLFAGFDLRRGEGRLFKYDVAGGRYEELDYHATGSGGLHAKNWLKAGWRPEIPASEAADLAMVALYQAADEDAATGGPDLVRQIYPTVAVIDRAGYAALSDTELAERAQRLFGGAAR